MYVTRSPGLTVNNAYIGLKISLEIITYHSLSNPPASCPSSPKIKQNRLHILTYFLMIFAYYVPSKTI